jgi:ribosome-associated toxin RatA of RatAB toxin-antitoxin module
MVVINLVTHIKAPIQVCFDASRNIDLHKASVPLNSKEEAVAGVMSGLINHNDTVTWRAKHFGFYFKMTVKISSMNAPNSFIDEQIKGPFKTMRHIHEFEQKEECTIMRDHFEFQVPYGILGKVLEAFILKAHMKKLLLKRNEYLKMLLES